MIVAELQHYVRNASIHPIYRQSYMERDAEFITDTRAQFMETRLEQAQLQQVSSDKGKGRALESQEHPSVDNTNSDGSSGELIIPSFSTAPIAGKRGSDTAGLGNVIRPKRLMSARHSRVEPDLRKLLGKKAYRAKIMEEVNAGSPDSTGKQHGDSKLMKGVKDLSIKSGDTTSSDSGSSKNDLLEFDQSLGSDQLMLSDNESDSGDEGSGSGSGPGSSAGGPSGGSGPSPPEASGGTSGPSPPEPSGGSSDPSSSSYIAGPRISGEDMLTHDCADTHFVPDAIVCMNWEYYAGIFADTMSKYDLSALWL